MLATINKPVYSTGDMRTQFNGKDTWLVINSVGDCVFTTDTERKATNYMNRALRDEGVTPPPPAAQVRWGTQFTSNNPGLLMPFGELLRLALRCEWVCTYFGADSFTVRDENGNSWDIDKKTRAILEA